MKTVLLALPALVVASGVARAAEDYEDRTYTDPKNNSIPYKLLIPKDYDKAKRYPLVLVLHGFNEQWANNRSVLHKAAGLFLKPDVRAKQPCFVVVPLVKAWVNIKDAAFQQPMPLAPNPSTNLRLAVAAVDDVMKNYSVDAGRVYVVGQSNGAYGTWDLVSRFPTRWAAAIPIAGGGDPARVVDAKNVPIWAFHGDKDKVVPVERSRELIAALKAAGGQPKYTELKNAGHGAGMMKAYDEKEFLTWLFAQKR